MLETELYPSRIFSPFREESGDEELSVLPRHTKVIVRKQQNKVCAGWSARRGQEGCWSWGLALAEYQKSIVEERKRCIILHILEVVSDEMELSVIDCWSLVACFLLLYFALCPFVVGYEIYDDASVMILTCKVLKNGVEVKLQRNALSVLEHATGNEVDEDNDFDTSSGSDIGEKDHDFSSGSEFHKISKPRVRSTRPCFPLAKSTNFSSSRDVQSITHTPQLKVNLAKLGTESLRRYCRRFNLAGVHSDSSREQMLNVVREHFASQQPLDEARVIAEFINAAKRRKLADRPME
ncbi:hypothetical protein GH714_010407 [Hevea brasiliensis]|uniref:Histone deacetylase complex subunit SAP30 Sin3 binding domain-containing protein n=1 Tax=Hevea brasiliensis TaxID=3981 RepID=A0A6A6MJ80_HEVBR|nr:hypothetical protein GH714_010407 [Hevea brasiliensis]